MNRPLLLTWLEILFPFTFSTCASQATGTYLFKHLNARSHGSDTDKCFSDKLVHIFTQVASRVNDTLKCFGRSMNVSFLCLVLDHNNSILLHLECPRSVILSDDLAMKAETQLMDSNSALRMLAVWGHHALETYSWIEEEESKVFQSLPYSFTEQLGVVLNRL